MTVHDIIRRDVAPFIPGSVLSSDGLERVRTVTSLIPSDVAFHFGFETRLYCPEPMTDFGICFVANANGDGPLQAALATLGHVTGDNLATNRVSRCVNLWRAAGIVASEPVNIWLEFDFVAPERPPLSNPNVFFSVPDVFWNESGGPLNSVLCHSIAVLADVTRSVDETAILRALRRSLPGDARIFEVGVMLGRAVRTIRVGIRSIRLPDIPVYLERVQWTGDTSSVQRILEAVSCLVDHIDIGLDIGERAIGNTVGLECYFKAGDRESWKRFSQFICSQGMALPSKVDAIGFFPGLVRNGQRFEPSRRPRQGGACLYELSIYHVKLSLGHGAPRAKAYLSAVRQGE